MITRYRYLLRIIFAYFIVSGLAIANVYAGKAQSEMDWTQLVNLSASGVASNPIAVVDSKATIHVVWIDAVDGYKYSQSQDGVTWSTPLTVKFPFGPKDPAPFLLADGDGSIHVFWITTRSEFFYARASSDNFSDLSRWKTNRLSKNASNFDAVVDSGGVLHLAYIENASDELGLAGVFYRQFNIGPGLWSPAVQIYQSEYFRATTSLTTYIRVAVSEQPSGKKVFISWDNRPLKRVFVASSADAGQTWSAAQQFKGPDDTGGSDFPFNISIWANGRKVLLMWQVGQPDASKCSIFSQWSDDDGQTWGDIIILFGGPTPCPSSIKFILSQNDQVVALLSSPVDSVLMAWNGNQWSEPQSQARLPSLANPATYDAILLGCRQDIIFKGRLFVFGCDQAKSGDIWFLSRILLPMDEWFKPSSLWSEPTIWEAEEQRISDIYSVADSDGNIHTIWVEMPTVRDGSKPYLQYTRWDGIQWTKPEAIIKDLDGVPQQLNVYLDSQNRLLLAWINGSNGDVLFSWSDLDQAGLNSGWAEPVVLPSPSQLNSSPDIVVDATGRIVVAFAVPYNENRGIYLVQSTDNGTAWSPSMQALDGVLTKWDRVNSPKIAISSNGVLHLLVTRQAEEAYQSTGLYYMQSRDGGVMWSDPEIVSKGAIYWSDLVAYGQDSIHRLWQEYDGLVVANLSQESRNGGIDWGQILDVTDVSETASPVTLTMDRAGRLYYIQLLLKQLPSNVNQDELVFKTSIWDGSRWNSDESHELRIKGRGAQYGVAVGLASNNYLSVALSASYTDVKGDIKNEVMTLGRFVEGPSTQGTSIMGTVPTPVFSSEVLQVLPSPMPTTMVNPTVLYDSNNPSEGMTKDLVGGVLIVLVTLIAIVLFVIRRPKKRALRETDE